MQSLIVRETREAVETNTKLASSSFMSIDVYERHENKFHLSRSSLLRTLKLFAEIDLFLVTTACAYLNYFDVISALYSQDKVL